MKSRSAITSRVGPGPRRLLSVLLASAFAGQAAQAAPECGIPPDPIVVSGETSDVAVLCPGQTVNVQSTGNVSNDWAVSAEYVDNIGSITLSGALHGVYGLYLSNGSMDGDIVVNAGATIDQVGGMYAQDSDAMAMRIRDFTVTGDIRVNGSLTYTRFGIRLITGSADEIVVGATGRIERNETTPQPSASSAAIALEEATVRRIENAGHLTYLTEGIRLERGVVTGELLNTVTGVIEGTDSESGRAGVGVLTESRVERVVNHGTIKGQYGILLSGENGAEITQGVLNTGTIEGRTAGVLIEGSPNLRIRGTLVNEGTLRGGQVGVSIQRIDGDVLPEEMPQISGGIVNRGTIEGAVMAIDAQGSASLPTLDIEGTRARIIGSVAAPYTDVTIRSGADFTLNNSVRASSLTVETGARLTLSEAYATSMYLSDGIELANGLNNQGTVVVGSGLQAYMSGTYNQRAGGRLEVGVGGMDQHGSLVVSGTATLAAGSGIHVVVAPLAELTIGGRLSQVIRADAVTVEGGVANLKVTDNSVKYKFVAVTSQQTAERPPVALPVAQPVLESPSGLIPIEFPEEPRPDTDLDLLVMKDDAPFVNSLGQGGGAVRNLAAMLDQLSASGVPAGLEPLVNQLRELPADQLEQNLNQLLPTLRAAGQQATLNAVRAVTTQILGRLESVRQGKSAGNSLTDRYAWVRTFGSVADQDNQGSAGGFRSRSHGLVVGADALVNPDWRAGLAFTYARTDLDSLGASAPGQLDVDTYSLAHYGQYTLDARTEVNYQLDVGLNQNKGKRFINLTSQQASSDYDSVNLHGGVGVSRQWQLGEASTVAPGVRLDYSRVRSQAYTETGAGKLSLNVGSARQEELVLSAELRGEHALTTHTRLNGFVSAGYNFSDRAASTTSAFVGGGTSFAAAGLTSAPWLYRAGFGLLHSLGNLEYNARFDLEHRDSGYLNQTLSFRVRWAF